jgi:hypothetical protein
MQRLWSAWVGRNEREEPRDLRSSLTRAAAAFVVGALDQEAIMKKHTSLSRRSLLAAGATGAAVAASSAVEAASFGNPDEPAEGAINVVNPKALSDPGPQDPNLANNQPAFLNPPPTDVNGMPQYWASFNLAPKRIQNGGWGRQVTQDDFKISTTIAAVDMRLGPGGVRELHRLTNRFHKFLLSKGFLAFPEKFYSEFSSLCSSFRPLIE